MADDTLYPDDLPEVVAVKRRPPRAEAERNFWSFTDDYPDRVTGFVASIEPSLTAAPASPAPFTPESLDVVEALFLERVHVPGDLDDPATREFFFDVFRYVGETILRTCGGEWKWEELWESGDEGAGLPYVRVDSPEGYLRGGTVNIYTTLTGAAGTRNGHYFRDLVTAIRDSFGQVGPLRRSSGWQAMGVNDPAAANPALRDYLADHEQALRAFTEQMAADGLELDCTPESLDRLEQVLLARYPDRASARADYDSDFYAGAARYVAETFIRSAGGRIDLVDPAVLTREVKPADRFPILQHVHANGEASADLTTTRIIDSAVHDKPVAGNEPRTGTTMREKLERYAAEANPEG